MNQVQYLSDKVRAIFSSKPPTIRFYGPDGEQALLVPINILKLVYEGSHTGGYSGEIHAANKALREILDEAEKVSPTSR